jgi:hypothetical protein
VLEFFDADWCKSHYDGSVGPLRRVRLSLAAGDPSAPGESYSCQYDGPACNTPKSRFRFDWNFHGSAFLPAPPPHTALQLDTTRRWLYGNVPLSEGGDSFRVVLVTGLPASSPPPRPP